MGQSECEKRSHISFLNHTNVLLQNQFVDGGAEMLFSIGGASAVIRSRSSGHSSTGMSYTLFLDGVEVTEQEIVPRVETKTRGRK